MTGHLEKRHPEEWGAYCEIRKRIKAEVADVKKEEVESCEMENSEVRFYDVRSSKWRLTFLAKVFLESDISCVNSFSVQMLPDVPESPVYWAEFDPRAEAAHRGIISQMVVDFQPLSLVQNKTEKVVSIFC